MSMLAVLGEFRREWVAVSVNGAATPIFGSRQVLLSAADHPGGGNHMFAVTADGLFAALRVPPAPRVDQVFVVLNSSEVVRERVGM
jgi:hypothetical protein